MPGSAGTISSCGSGPVRVKARISQGTATKHGQQQNAAQRLDAGGFAFRMVREGRRDGGSLAHEAEILSPACAKEGEWGDDPGPHPHPRRDPGGAAAALVGGAAARPGHRRLVRKAARLGAAAADRFHPGLRRWPPWRWCRGRCSPWPAVCFSGFGWACSTASPAPPWARPPLSWSRATWRAAPSRGGSPAHPAFARIDRAVGRDGLRIALLLRLSPFFPFVWLNYALGLTRVRFRDYLLASLRHVAGHVPLRLFRHGGRQPGCARRQRRREGAVPLGGLLYWVFLALGLGAAILVATLVGRIAGRALGEEAGLDGDDAGGGQLGGAAWLTAAASPASTPRSRASSRRTQQRRPAGGGAAARVGEPGRRAAATTWWWSAPAPPAWSPPRSPPAWAPRSPWSSGT